MDATTDRGQLILTLADMFPADLSHTADQLLLVSKIADFIRDCESIAFAEGMMKSHAAHELELENAQVDVRRRLHDTWEHGYTEGYDDGKEGRFHQVLGKE
jgi:hypothetical protein